MKETVVISVDYESPSAHRVARDIWSALSRTALNTGFDGITARWESLQEQEVVSKPENSPVCIFIVGQDRPESVECISALEKAKISRVYGVVVAVTGQPNPLSGSLLYQGVGRLTADGVRAGSILPALIPVSPKTECEAYAARLFERLQRARA